MAREVHQHLPQRGWRIACEPFLRSHGAGIGRHGQQKMRVGNPETTMPPTTNNRPTRNAVCGLVLSPVSLAIEPGCFCFLCLLGAVLRMVRMLSLCTSQCSCRKAGRAANCIACPRASQHELVRATHVAGYHRRKLRVEKFFPCPEYSSLQGFICQQCKFHDIR
eukprot:5355645-Amphidinium_carterae.1